MSILLRDTKMIEKLIRSIDKWANARNENQRKEIFQAFNNLYYLEQYGFDKKGEIFQADEKNVNSFAHDLYNPIECIRLVDSLECQILPEFKEYRDYILKDIRFALLTRNGLKEDSYDFEKQYQNSCVL